MIDRNLLIPNRRGKIRVGVNGLNFPVFAGRSDIPKATKSTRQASIHLEDELSYLERYKLSEGELQIDVSTEQYLWSILDKVYSDYTQIDNGDWSDTVAETNNYRVFNPAVSFNSSDNPTASVSVDIATVDYVSFFLYTSDVDLLTQANLVIEYASGEAVFDLLPRLQSGWLTYNIPLQYFVGLKQENATGVRIDLTASSQVDFFMDAFRFVNTIDYPLRSFDTSLQTIPVAWWSGNTALYEIKTAVEAEGGRFFSDHNGVLNFWNRQHFQVNTEFQSVKHGFTYNRMMDLEYPADIDSVINTVEITIDPLKIAPEEDIWKYPETFRLNSGQSRVIWADYNNPTPLDSVVSPVATTDYTANDTEDGLGTDRTASVEIVDFTKFTTSSKITIKNNHSGTIYVTMLKVRGTPAKKVSEIENVSSSKTKILVQNETSFNKYGEMPSGALKIENKYLANYQDGEFLANFLVDTYNKPLTRIELQARSYPTLAIGDVIQVHDEDLNRNKIMRVVGIKDTFSSDGLNQSVLAREITPAEQFTYFTVGVSAIGGNDKISP